MIINLNEDLQITLHGLATSHEITTDELLRKFIRLGLVANDIEQDPESELIVKDANGFRALYLFDEPQQVELIELLNQDFHKIFISLSQETINLINTYTASKHANLARFELAPMYDELFDKVWHKYEEFILGTIVNSGTLTEKQMGRLNQLLNEQRYKGDQK